MAKKKIEIEVVVDDKGTTKKVALSQKDLEKALKKAKRREFLYKVGTIAGGVFAVLFLTK